MARRASARLAAHLRSSAGGMTESTRSYSIGVGCKHPVIIRRAQSKLVCLLLLQIGAQYSAGAYSSARAEVRSVNAPVCFYHSSLKGP